MTHLTYQANIKKILNQLRHLRRERKDEKMGVQEIGGIYKKFLDYL